MNGEYLDKLELAIYRLHRCGVRHIESVAVAKVPQPGVTWTGVVEVFAVDGVPHAKRCYAWSYQGQRSDSIFVAILETPQIGSPLEALEFWITEKPKRFEITLP